VNIGSQFTFQAIDPTTGNPQPGTWEVTPPGGTPQRTTQPQSDYAFTASIVGTWKLAFYLPGATTPAWTVSFSATAPSQVAITVVQSTDPNLPAGGQLPTGVSVPVNVGSQFTFQAIDPTTNNPLAGTWEVTPPGGTPQQTAGQSDYAFTASTAGQWKLTFYLPGATTPAWTVLLQAG
jgi:hypothetical protein